MPAPFFSGSHLWLFFEILMLQTRFAARRVLCGSCLAGKAGCRLQCISGGRYRCRAPKIFVENAHPTKNGKVRPRKKRGRRTGILRMVWAAFQVRTLKSSRRKPRENPEKNIAPPAGKCRCSPPCSPRCSSGEAGRARQAHR